MIQVKCINKIRDKHNIIQYYTLIDRQGNQKTVTTEAIKMAIKNNQLECINLTLTSDNRLIDKSDKTIQKPVQHQPQAQGIVQSKIKTPVELYKDYINKIKVLGKEPDAIYEIQGEDVILKKVLIENGTFTIQPFVTKCVNISFRQCENIKIINKSSITDMSHMFYLCDYLQSLDLSEFNASKVTDMHNMLSGCESLQSLDLSNFDTSKVTDIHGMFSGCKSLQSLDLSSFNTSQVTDMSGMFGYCENLQNLDLSNFDTSQVTDMEGMFIGCYELQNIDLSKFDTSKVLNNKGMFKDCGYCDVLRVPKALAKSFREKLGDFYYDICKENK